MGIEVDEDMVAPFGDLGSDDLLNLYPHEYVAAMAALDITRGASPGVFSPWGDITRAHVVTMIVRAAQSLKPGLLVPVPAGYLETLGGFSSDHADNLALAERNGLFSGLVGYGAAWDPWAFATRGEVAQMLWNLVAKVE